MWTMHKPTPCDLNVNTAFHTDSVHTNVSSRSPSMLAVCI